MKNEPERFEISQPPKGFKAKVVAWVKRFLPAELIGSALAIAASYLAFHFLHSKVIAAYAAATADTTGFYVTIAARDTLTLSKDLRSRSQRFSGKHALQVLKNMLLEFGPAELLDSLLLRPFFMYFFPVLLHSYASGIIAGKIVSDVCFYIPVILISEWRIWHGKKLK